MNAFVLYVLLLRATALSFSGLASVPMIREELVVSRSVTTDQQLNSAIAISQASPGPLGLYVVVVGYFAAGWAARCAGVLTLASPALLALPLGQSGATSPRRAGAWRMCRMVLASCVLMAATTTHLAADTLTTQRLVLLTVTGFAAVATERVPPVVIVFASALLGPWLGQL